MIDHSRPLIPGIFLAVLTLPSLVFGLACLAVLGVLGMVTCLRVSGSGAWSIDATWRPWVARRWKYSTTLGLSVIYNPKHLENPTDRERLQRHESVHVRQHENQAISGALLAIPLFFIAPLGALVVWCLSPLLPASHWIGAMLRGKPPYLGAEDERSARAQVETGIDLW